MESSEPSGSGEATNDVESDVDARPDDDSAGTVTDGSVDTATDSSAAADGERRESTIDAARRTLRRVVKTLQGSTVDVGDYEPDRHGSLVTFDDPDGFEEVDRYWVNAPFSFISIGYDHAANEHRYRTVEPTLREDEAVLLETLLEDVRDPLLYREDEGNDVESLLRETIREYLERYGAEIDTATFYRLFYFIHRDFRGYGPLDPIMHDPHVEDISCDGYELPIFVYHDEYTDIETNVSFAKPELDRFVVRLAQHSGRHISIGDPMVETTLPDGSRAELANRERFLEYLQENDIADYRRFTALVNEYYSDPDRILETISDDTVDDENDAVDDADTDRADTAADDADNDPAGDDDSATTRIETGSVDGSTVTEADSARDG